MCAGLISWFEESGYICIVENGRHLHLPAFAGMRPTICRSFVGCDRARIPTRARRPTLPSPCKGSQTYHHQGVTSPRSRSSEVADLRPRGGSAGDGAGGSRPRCAEEHRAQLRGHFECVWVYACGGRRAVVGPGQLGEGLAGWLAGWIEALTTSTKPQVVSQLSIASWVDDAWESSAH